MAALIILFALTVLSVYSYFSMDAFYKAYDNYPVEVLMCENVVIKEVKQTTDLLDSICLPFELLGSKIASKISFQWFAFRVIFAAKQQAVKNEIQALFFSFTFRFYSF